MAELRPPTAERPALPVGRGEKTSMRLRAPPGQSSLCPRQPSPPPPPQAGRMTLMDIGLINECVPFKEAHSCVWGRSPHWEGQTRILHADGHRPAYGSNSGIPADSPPPTSSQQDSRPVSQGPRRRAAGIEPPQPRARTPHTRLLYSPEPLGSRWRAAFRAPARGAPLAEPVRRCAGSRPAPVNMSPPDTARTRSRARQGGPRGSPAAGPSRDAPLPRGARRRVARP